MSLFSIIVSRIRGFFAAAKAEVHAIERAVLEIKLDARAADYAALDGQKLDWRHSIVDLLKAIGIDSGIATRAELAAEFGIAHYRGEASQNIALHDAIITNLAAHQIALPPRI